MDARAQRLRAYRPAAFEIMCERCRRSAVLERDDMIKRFGDVTLGECARKVAAAKGCHLAEADGQAACGVLVVELSYASWARLADARDDGWTATLRCQRSSSGMGKARSCTGLVDLDVPTLVAALGEQTDLRRVQEVARCPTCGAVHVDVAWHPPDERPAPSAAQREPAQILRLKATKAALGRRRFDVIG